MKCHCGVCKNDHELVMNPEEYRACVAALKGSLNQNGRLIIECDDCTAARNERSKE